MKKRINSKAKGNKNELECTKILDERFGKGLFLRVPSSGAITGKSNKVRIANISDAAKDTLSGDIITPANFAFSIEHKAYKEASFWDLFNKSSNLFEWFKQSTEDAEFVNKKPLLIIKYNRHERIAFVWNWDLKLLGLNHVFEINNWRCYYLSDLLKLEDSFWYM